MYRHVLVPVDLGHGDLGPRILRVAKGLTAPDGALTLLSVLEPVPAYVANYIPAGIGESTRNEAAAKLADIARAAGVDARVTLRTGNAATEIIEEAKSAGCDAIVIGSHRPDYRDYFIGSTAAKVVRHAPVTVIVERSSPI